MSDKQNIGDQVQHVDHIMCVADTHSGVDHSCTVDHSTPVDPASNFGDHNEVVTHPFNVAETDCGTGLVKMAEDTRVEHAGSAPETGDLSNCVDVDQLGGANPSLLVGVDLGASVSRPECAAHRRDDSPSSNGGTPDPATAVFVKSIYPLSPETNRADHGKRLVNQGEAVGADEIDPRRIASHVLVVDLAPLISDIIVEHTRRQAAIKAQRRLDQAAGAMIRRLCGWDPNLEEKQRTAINKQAERIFKALERGKELELTEDEQIARIAHPFVFASLQAREPFDLLRKNAEKTMAERGKQLPVWPWVNAIRGIDVGGLCAIIGEAGDLNNYSNPAKLWKRLGVGVLDGKRQGNPGKEAKPEDWIRHGYSPRRRSIMWNVGYALVMSNGEGRYRSAYLRYKERLTVERSGPWVYVDPEGQSHEREAWTKGHIARASQRYMEKLFLRDLWTVWRRVTNPKFLSCETLVKALASPDDEETRY